MTVKPSSAEQISHLLCVLQGRVHGHGRIRQHTELCHLVRGREGSCCVPGPGLFLLHSSFHPLSPPLGLCSLENPAITLSSLFSDASSSAWKHTLLSLTEQPSLPSTSHLSASWPLVSPSPGKGVCSVSILSPDLIFAPTILFISLSLPLPTWLQFFDCPVFFSL